MRRTRLSILFLFILMVILIISSDGAHSSFSVWPAKLTISINNGFPDEKITYKIEVNNNNPYETSVIVKFDDPVPHRKKEGYTNIPDLSWIKTNESIVKLKSGESKFVEIFLDIPDDQKRYQYNENWEVWASFSEVRDETTNPSGGSASIVSAVAVRLFIDTPIKEQSGQGENNFLYLLFALLLIGIIAILYMRLKTTRKKKSSIFYFRRNKKNV